MGRRQDASQQFYNTLSTRSRLLLDAAIFCLFAPLSLALDIAAFGRRGMLSVVLVALMSGATAVLYARGGFTGRLKRYFAAGILLQAGVTWFARWVAPSALMPVSLDGAGIEALAWRLKVEAALLFAFVILGYTLFIAVWTREGRRFFARGTEIRLAQRIHQRLVPSVAGRTAYCEWAGISRPSGEIGGDLVDAIEGPAGVIGCVADVSGHGVGAGLLMGMFKTAFRAAAEETSEPSLILARVHVTLGPLTEPNMYITAAVARLEGRSLDVAGGGHPPMLLYRSATRQVQHIASTGPAIALLDDFNCRTMSMRLEPGDIALLLTDGITEALDTREQEIGIDAVARVVVQHAEAPLDQMLATISALAAAVARADDQTLLAVRAL